MIRHFGKVPNVKFRWGMLDVVDFGGDVWMGWDGVVMNMTTLRMEMRKLTCVDI